MKEYYPNQNINLSVLLESSATDKIINARIYDDESNVISQSDIVLSHLENGMYTNSSELMPDLDMINVVFFIYESDGVTLLAMAEEEVGRKERSGQHKLIGRIRTSLKLVGIIKNINK